jgi:hypothetical protein
MDMADENNDRANGNGQVKASGGRRRILGLMWGFAAALAVLAVVLGLLVVKAKPEASGGLHTRLGQIQSEVGFPLYYPSSLPEGFTPYQDSARVDAKTAVSYALTYKESRKVVIALQPRPPLMEEVNKIREFLTPTGKAYIADLNGHKAGFLLTAETLMIISSTYELDTADLQALLHSMKGL